MAQDEELTKVHIDLPNNPDTGGEAMWAKALGGDLYELRNNPFFAYGLNFLDVVLAVSRAPDQKPSVLRVVRRSGHRTIWVTFTDEADGHARARRLEVLNQWRGFYEGRDDTHFVVDVEPRADFAAVLDQLVRWRDQGILTYHMGAKGGFEPQNTDDRASDLPLQEWVAVRWVAAQTNEQFRSLARIQIIFATAGLLVGAAGQAFTLQPLTITSYSISGAFLGLALFAGKKLRQGSRRGILLSFIVQVLQIIHLNFLHLGYFFLAGPFIELGASSSIVLVTGGAGALGYVAPNPTTGFVPGTWLGVHFGFRLSLAEAHPTIAVGVNVVALVFAIRLWRLWRTTSVSVPSSSSTALPAA